MSIDASLAASPSVVESAADWSFRLTSWVGHKFLPPAASAALSRISSLCGRRPSDFRFLRLKTCFVFRDRAGYIYRMPANARTASGFRGEYEMLDRVRPHLPFPTPSAVLLGDDPPVARYLAIPGEALPRVLDDWRRRGEIAWRDQLGEWLAALHGVEPPPGSPTIPLLARSRTMPDRLRGRTEAATRIADEIESAAAEASSRLAGRSGPGVLCHGDLKGGNVRADTRRARITGVIDFSAWGLAPAEWDLVRLRLPPEEIAALMPIYERAARRTVDRHLFDALLRLDDAIARGRRTEEEWRRRSPGRATPGREVTSARSEDGRV